MNENDPISREAALSCFHDWIDKHGNVHTPDEMAEYRAIEGLPPAQSEIIRCNNCAKRNDMGYCTKFQNNIHGIATSWYVPDDDDFCSSAERKDL